MSKVKIQGNASGTGTLTISAPNTNTDRTINLPDDDITLAAFPDAIDVNASAPADSLAIDASGNVSVTGDLQLGSDSVASNINIVGDVFALNVDSNANSGGAPNMQFKTSGTERLKITNDGRGLSQFTAKAWIKLHQGNNSIYDSHNVSSISHPESGQTLVNFSNSMGNTNYCAVASSGQFYSGNTGIMDFYSGSLRVVNSSSSSYTDTDKVNVVVFGD